MHREVTSRALAACAALNVSRCGSLCCCNAVMQGHLPPGVSIPSLSPLPYPSCLVLS